MNIKKAEKILISGGIGVLVTDTIYGIVGRALNKQTVERIYKVKKRNFQKPFIILISSIDDIELFDIKVSKREMNTLKRFWPGKVSVILPCASKRFSYLHRKTKGLAFRLPKKKYLLDLLKNTGPLVAPSANPEGLVPASNIKEAKKYFGNKVDFYLDSGRKVGRPSTLIELNDDKISFLRK